MLRLLCARGGSPIGQASCLCPWCRGDCRGRSACCRRQRVGLSWSAGLLTGALKLTGEDQGASSDGLLLIQRSGRPSPPARSDENKSKRLSEEREGDISRAQVLTSGSKFSACPQDSERVARRRIHRSSPPCSESVAGELRIVVETASRRSRQGARLGPGIAGSLASCNPELCCLSAVGSRVF